MFYKIHEVSLILFTFNLQDAIPHAKRRQTRNQISTPMMTLIGSVSHVSLHGELHLGD
jgi:hypothetical protein